MRSSATPSGRAHAKVAAALEEVHGGRVREHAAELAEHYRLAGPAYARSAWHFALRAGEAAAAGAEHDEALRLLTEAAVLQGGDPTVEPAERETVLRGRARALTRVARPLEAWEPAAEAARSALARRDGAAAAEALLTVTERVVWGWRTHPTWDDEAIELWQTVLEQQPREDVLTRARINAAIAVEMLYRPGSAHRATVLADQAVAMVRSTGRRGHAELQVLRLAQMALLRPDLLHHRAALRDEIVSLALEVGDPIDVAAALTARAQDLGELGRLQEMQSDVVRAHELAVRHHLPQNIVVSGWCLSLRKQVDGDLAGAEQDIAEIERFQATLAMSGVGIEVSQRANLRDVEGRLGEMEPHLRRAAPYHPAFRELHALSLLRAGRVDELRLLLGSYDEQPAFSFDYMWLPYMAVRAEVWSGLGDAAAAARMYDELLPYGDRLAYSVPVAFRGSMHLALGELARVAGDPTAAARHLEMALQVHRELGLAHWVGRTEEALTRLAGTVVG
ncbi:hypothetical protein [Nocardioides caldifontis]|uniref:hypothetical protein n=1 Tax=Nocardioides caldifontis TaxID=2588938 RepID=UPI0011DEFF6B|nr:hypothetical protein [Nocardioides caldifontis]